MFENFTLLAFPFAFLKIVTFSGKVSFVTFSGKVSFVTFSGKTESGTFREKAFTQGYYYFAKIKLMYPKMNLIFVQKMMICGLQKYNKSGYD